VSGEHRITIGESLQAKTFIVPDNFIAPQRHELIQLPA